MSGHWSDHRWKVNPTTRTLAWLEEQGWDACDVERKQGRVRFDLWGYADIVAQRTWAEKSPEDFAYHFPLGGDFLFVQATTGQNVNARVRKVLAEPRAKRTLLCEGLIWVVGWRRLKRGGDRMEPMVREILLEDFDG
jgi:hypothetical protein